MLNMWWQRAVVRNEQTVFGMFSQIRDASYTTQQIEFLNNLGFENTKHHNVFIRYLDSPSRVPAGNYLSIWDCFILVQLVSFTEIQEPPLFVPLHPYQGIKEKEVKCAEPDMSPTEKVQQAVDCLQSSPQDQDALINSSQLLGFQRRRIVDYAKAYTSGETTSIMIAYRLIDYVRESSSWQMQMSFFINFYEEDILKQAREFTLRYKRGGPKWMHKVRECKHDACCVSCLRSCGSIIFGKTNMHELGAGLSGIHPQ